MWGITEEGSHSTDAAMGRLYDPAFKLFGRTIPVSSDSKETASGEQEPGHTSRDTSSIQHVDETPDSEDEGSVPEELGSSSGSNDGCEEEKVVASVGGDLEGSLPHAPNSAKEGMLVDACIAVDEHREVGTLSQAPKKPDKPVHCPRCKSLDTKFCYFNNYNVNQPRHFCKNCQRYWTAGGTLRNVPVGAGRRKNKHSATNPRSLLPDVVMVRNDPPDNAQHLLSASSISSQASVNRHIKAGLPPRNLLSMEVQSLATMESPTSSAVLNFGQESPVCRSTGTAPFTPCRMEVLQGYKPEMSQAQEKRNLSMNGSTIAMGAQMDQKACDEKQRNEQNASNTVNEAGANVDKHAIRQLVGEIPTECAQLSVPLTSTAPKPEVGGTSDIPKYVDAALAWASSAPFSFMGAPWQYGANLGWGNTILAAAQGANVNPVATLANLAQGPANSCNTAGTKPHAQPGTFGPGQPPWAAAMGPWAGIPWPLMQNPFWGPPGWGGGWTMPWAAPFTAAAAVAAAAVNPELGSTILGKHPREQAEADMEKVLVPKTLRIDDPGEAARSSIWSTLGIDLRSDTLAVGGIFGDLKSKADSRKGDDLHNRTRSSNPAGLDRSLSFQENSMAPARADATDK